MSALIRRYSAQVLAGVKRVVKRRMGAGTSLGVDWQAVSDAAVRLEPTDFESAMALHMVNARLDPQNALMRFRYGLALRRTLKVREALDHFEFAVRQDPACGPYWTMLIEQALDLMPVDEALAFLDALPQPQQGAREGYDKATLFNLFRVGAGAQAVERAGHLFGDRCLSVRQVEAPLWKYGFDVLFEEGGFRLEYGSLFLGWPFLIDRTLAQIPYLSKLSKHAKARGRLHLNVGDMPEGTAVQLCFCGDAPNHLLIPDSVFLSSGAYSDFMNGIVASAPAWQDRISKLYWRGSLTGQAETFEEIFELPRIKLVQISASEPRIDARITDLSQFGPLLPELEFRCRDMDLLGPREPESEICKYRYQIDIDGNTNSWPGLWQKMISGSPVIKLRSHYRQWYYDHLEHNENLILIDDLHEELIPAMDRLFSDPDLARSLAANAQAMMSRMTPQSEYKVFEAAALNALNSR